MSCFYIQYDYLYFNLECLAYFNVLWFWIWLALIPFHFLLSCIGEGNGNPLQCSCLENPMDGEAWWPAVYGVAQSQIRLKWLSSSSGGSFNSTTLLFSIFTIYFFWFIFPSYSNFFWINWIYFIISFYLHCWLISCNSLLCYFSGCFNLSWFTFKRYYATSCKIWEPFNSYFYFSSPSLCYCYHTITST